ncbi:Ubiquitin carboxyl-terminal hydrolase 32 (Deubiquitinating enzyme 32) (Renal carcinoma antigen NY-REN-60) (Ubiquitin thioesterase 32) (Ubiquitin-specific-processing protease 32) [Durusdinium trenchii]|uniref:Ubiquitin carboxyl-terminal hydrolase 32 (Deubiquitinating enzyme 32) (Renal carcinoma antigen NY-REN-60) (Ubiquitin thioesterase 32) (Ubiquitin-specific-processing protease 32) n=1 Tax=Durusdinium trenchii TaxID=1381693 RepID=A0ABP0HQ22_9DINO
MGNSPSRAGVSLEVARKRFSNVELHVFEEGFDRLCKANPRFGFAEIDYETFSKLLLADFPDIPEALTQRMFAVMDTNGSGSLDQGEFVCGLCVLCRSKLEERLRFLFAVYDVHNKRALDRKTLEHFADLLDDPRLTQDERFSSRALIDEAFKMASTPRGTSLGGADLTMEAFSKVVVRFTDAPLISWCAHVGQRLLDPLFQLPEPSPSAATTRMKRSMSKLRFDAADKAPGRAVPPVSSEQKHMLRYQSSRGQLKEASLFKRHFVAPTQDAFVPGESWFVVATSWFVSWKKYAGLTDDGFGLEACSPKHRRHIHAEGREADQQAHMLSDAHKRPGPIDNRELLRPGTSGARVALDSADQDAFYALRPDTHFRHDFVLLNRGSWEILFKAYGSGPVLERKVIVGDNGLPELELYPVTLNVRCVAFSSEDENDPGFLVQHAEEPAREVHSVDDATAATVAMADKDDTQDVSSRSDDTSAASVASDEDEAEGRASRRSKQIVVSKRANVKDLEFLILQECIGEPFRSRQNASESVSSVSSVSSQQEAVQDGIDRGLEAFSLERMRLWSVLESSDPLGLPVSLDPTETREASSTVPSVSPKSFSALRSASVNVQLLTEPEQTVEDANLEDGQTVVLELSSADGCWPLASVETLRSMRPRGGSFGGANPADDDCGENGKSDHREERHQHQQPVLMLGGGPLPHERHRSNKHRANQGTLTVSSSAHARMADGEGAQALALARKARTSKAGTAVARQQGNVRIPGNIGLCNLGNTCFMSAALQCLIHTELFKDYFVSGSWVLDVNLRNSRSTKGQLAEAFADLISTAWQGKSPPWSAPRKFKKELAKFDKRFTGFEQQDAQEMLGSLLDGLSEDLNRVQSKAYIELADSNGRADEVVAREWWENHLRRELSIITAMFTGQFKSLLECCDCGYQSARFEPYMLLSLPLPDSPFRTVSVHVVFADASRPTLKCCVRVDKMGTFEDVKNALLELQPGVAGEVIKPMDAQDERPARSLESARMILAFVYDRQIFSFARDDQPLRKLRDGDPLYAFELPVIGGLDMSETEFAEDGKAVLGDDQADIQVGTQVRVLQDSSDGELGTVVKIIPGKPSKKGQAENKYEVRIPVEVARENEANHYRTIKIPESRLMMEPLEPMVIRVEQRQWHKHTCYFLNPYRTTTVGMPFALFTSPDRLTGRELYQAISRQLGISEDEDEDEDVGVTEGTDKAGPEQDSPDQGGGKDLEAPGPSVAERKRTDVAEKDEAIRELWGFKLVLVTQPGGSCGCCSWMNACNGCPIIPDDNLVSLYDLVPGSTVAVDWGFASSIKDQHLAHSVQVLDTHSSVEEARKEEYKEMPLSDLIDNFSRSEKLQDFDQVRCSNCKDFKDHTKKIELWRAPPVLVIHLKRFQHSGYRKKKLLNLIKFPINDLNMHPYLAQAMPERDQPKAKDDEEETPDGDNAGGEDEVDSGGAQQVSDDALSDEKEGEDEKEETGSREDEITQQDQDDEGEEESVEAEKARLEDEARQVAEELLDSDFLGLKAYGGHKHGGIRAEYDLYGVVEHSGSLGSGHYVATAKNPGNGEWYLFDDKIVTKIDEANVLSSNAYLLFYVRKDVQALDSVSGIFPAESVNPKDLKTKLKELQPHQATEASSKCSIM